MSHDRTRETSTTRTGQEATMSTSSAAHTPSTNTRRDLDGIPPMVPCRPLTAAEMNIQRWLAGKGGGKK
jgi:hypothetical protein